jgi:hypothetical protein
MRWARYSKLEDRMKDIGQGLLSLTLLAGVSLLSQLDAAASSPRVAKHSADLFGGYVISPSGRADAGDPEGSGIVAITVQPDVGPRARITLCYSLIVHNLGTATVVHIHEGKPGRNGPIRVQLNPPKRVDGSFGAPSLGDNGYSAGCLLVNHDLGERIAFTPNEFYVDVHTDVFPNGALRGRLD